MINGFLKDVTACFFKKKSSLRDILIFQVKLTLIDIELAVLKSMAHLISYLSQTSRSPRGF